MPEAKFVLKEPNGSASTLVYLFYNFKYSRLKYSTGEKINPKFWNLKKQRAKETSQFVQYPEFNQRLSNIENAVNNAFRRLQNDGIEVTVELLRKELDIELGIRDNVKVLDFVEWMRNEIEILKNNKKEGSVKVYITLLNHLQDFSAKKKYKLTFDSINLAFYEQFENYILNEKKLLTNTFGKQIKTLKTFLNIATEKGIKTNPEYKSRLFKAIQEDVNHVYLSEEELDCLYAVDLAHKPYLDRVRDVFLVGCHTGLRFSDFSQLREENLEERTQGFVFNVKTSKTGERIVVPLKPVVLQIWKKYNGKLPRAISNQKMNEYLKELGKVAGITQNVIVKKTRGKEVVEKILPKFECVSTHTARRSFATNAYLSGIPSISIMKLTGHKTEASFMKYIKVSQERNADLLMQHSFFK